MVHVGSRDSFEAMNQAIAYIVRPVVDSVFTFDQAARAYASLGASGHFGKTVIRHD